MSPLKTFRAGSDGVLPSTRDVFTEPGLIEGFLDRARAVRGAIDTKFADQREALRALKDKYPALEGVILCFPKIYDPHVQGVRVQPGDFLHDSEEREIIRKRR